MGGLGFHDGVMKGKTESSHDPMPTTGSGGMADDELDNNQFLEAHQLCSLLPYYGL
jgi:hypothetical protein